MKPELAGMEVETPEHDRLCDVFNIHAGYRCNCNLVGRMQAALVAAREERARDKVTHDLDLQGKMLEVAAQQLKEAESELARMREALRKYGMHLAICLVGLGPDRDCDCGLDALLSEGSIPKEGDEIDKDYEDHLANQGRMGEPGKLDI